MLRIHASKAEPESLIDLFSRVNDLLSVDVEVRRVAKSTRGKGEESVSAGDFLVIDNSMESALGLARRFADEAGLKTTKMSSYDPNTAPRLRTPLVGLYSGYGTSPYSLVQLHEALERAGFNLVSSVDSRDLEGTLSKLDVLVVPGGDSTEIALSIGPENARAIRKFVEAGGTYIGICAGSFVGLSPATGTLGPNHPLFTSCQEELGSVKVQILCEPAEVPKVPMWSYKNFGNVVRLYPYEGDVKFKAKKRSDPITVGLPASFVLRMEGPVFKVKDSADALVVSEGPILTTTFGVRPSGAESMFVQFDAIVRKKQGSGRYVLSSPHIESPDHPEGVVLLANSLFSAVSGTLSPYIAPSSQKLDPRSASLLMASIVDQSDELSRSMQRLSQYMLVLIPLISSTESARHSEKIGALGHSLLRLSQVSHELARMTVEVIEEEQHLDKLLASLSGDGTGPTVVTGIAQRLVSLISRVDLERNSMTATAGRALPALMMVSLKLEKEAAELISKLTKGEDIDVLKEVVTLIEKIAGDKAFFVPWYDAREGLASDDPPSQGVISPLMGIRAKMRHVRKLSRTTRLLSTS